MSYIPLATVTLGGSDTEVVFASIPPIFKDLILVADFVAATTTNAELLIRFNSDSGNNYSQVKMTGNGSSTSSSSASSVNGARIGYGPTTSARSNSIAQIMDYAATDKHKTLLTRTNESDEVWATACRWANTSAITSVSFLYEGVSLGTGSTFSLYGVA